jgi:6-phosphofructokinase 2
MAVPDIATLTMNPSVDRSCQVDQLRPNDKLRCRAVLQEPGGGGLNVARVIQTLGGQSMALWTRGGGNGASLEALIDAYAIEHQPIPLERETRDNLTVFERRNEQQYRFTMPGPQMRDAEATAALEQCAALDPMPRYFVASGSLPPGAGDDFYARLGRSLPAETRLMVDASEQPLREAIKAAPYMVKVNLRELGHIAGEEVKSDREIDAVGRRVIAEHGVSVVLVSLGAGGARWVTGEGAHQLASPTVPIRSRVGAGDSMVAGTVLGLAKGWSLTAAVRYGVAAGAAAVMTAGTELCRAEDVDRLFEQSHS